MTMTSRLQVIFEDQAILVVNKPAGVIVNRSDTTSHEVTLQEMVEQYLRIDSTKPHLISQRRVGEWETPEDAFYNRTGIVHRLDKETSGILLVAKNVASFANLQKQFKGRLVKKTYRALAHGRVAPEKGEISVPVGRLEFNRKRFGVVAGGRESVTDYEVINHYKNPATQEAFSLVELYPKTGRTHQIRVHLQYIGHPIFGDALYAGRKQSREDRKVLPRVFLHAAKINFLHPENGKPITCEAPLPQELSNMLLAFQEA